MKGDRMDIIFVIYGNETNFNFIAAIQIFCIIPLLSDGITHFILDIYFFRISGGAEGMTGKVGLVFWRRQNLEDIQQKWVFFEILHITQPPVCPYWKTLVHCGN